MSTTPPSGPPSNPPSGGEYLEHGGGNPIRPERPARRSRRPAVLGGVGIATLAVVGGGIWAATSFFGTGSQPAEALPAGTLGYLSVDLDPSGGQKIAALETLNKFPAFEDSVGITAEDDLRREVVEYLLAEGDCDVDYADTVEPWLGSRFAVAALDLGGDEPAPVVVGQVSDAGAADDGLATIIDECGSGEGGAWAFTGDWVVVGEDQDTVDSVVADAEESSLADDEAFAGWMSEVGEPGIMTGYLAPSAGALLAETFGAGAVLDDDAGAATDEAVEALEDFGGAAMALRFADGGFELEAAGDAAPVGDVEGTQLGAAAVGTLPEDTAVALGFGLEEGWFDRVLEAFGDAGMTGVDADTMIDEVEAATGLTLPEDVETLFGESTALAVGADLDPSALFASADGSGIPVAVKVQGEPDEIEAVLEKLRSNPEAEPVAAYLGSDAEGNAVAIGPNAEYRAEVVGDGGLRDSAVFQDVLPDADRAAGVVFVNVDAGDGWLAELAEGDTSLTENIEPLAAIGLAAWLDGDTVHVKARLSTD